MPRQWLLNMDPEAQVLLSPGPWSHAHEADLTGNGFAGDITVPWPWRVLKQLCTSTHSGSHPTYTILFLKKNFLPQLEKKDKAF